MPFSSCYGVGIRFLVSQNDYTNDVTSVIVKRTVVGRNVTAVSVAVKGQFEIYYPVVFQL